MELGDAIAFIRPATSGATGTWADLGAGTGTFTRALAAILGPEGRVLAVDRDRDALATLRRRAASGGPERAGIVAVDGDFERLDAIAELEGVTLDGALFGNALHFSADAEGALARAVARVRPGGRVVVIEYDGVRANRWVPHPLPVDRLERIAPIAGLGPPEVVARRPSVYQRGTLYCAVAIRPV